MRKQQLPLLISLSLFAAGCDQSVAPQTRSFAPRIASVPTGTNIVRVEIADHDLGTSTTNSSNGFYRFQEAAASAGSMALDGLPNSGPLWFRISGIDANRTPVWSSQGAVPDGNQSSVKVGDGGVAISSPPTPSLTISGTSVQVSCTNGWPAWTLDNSQPGPSNPSTNFTKNGNTVSVPTSSGQTVTANCTDGYSWGSVQTWKNAGQTTTLPDPGTILPQLSYNLPTSLPGSLTFYVNGGTSTYSYTNWQVQLKIGAATAWEQHPLSYALNLTTTTTVTAYLVAWDGTSSTWVTGPTSSTTVSPNTPSMPDPGNTLPTVGFNTPAAIPGPLTFYVPGGTTSYYTNWQVQVKTGNATAWTQQPLGNSFNVAAATTVTAYLVAWDATNSKWVAGPTNSIVISATTNSLASPVFNNMSGGAVTGTLLIDSTAVPITMTASQGSILYTIDGMDPIQGGATTLTWLSGSTIPFPATSQTLTLKAMAVLGSQVSPIAILAVSRPTWNLIDAASVGCIESSNGWVAACGDSRGPLTWNGSSWSPLDGTWNYGAVTALMVSDTDIVVSTAKQIFQRSRSGANFRPWGVDSGVMGLARFHDTLFASRRGGVDFWNGFSWMTMGSTAPAYGGPLLSTGDALWAGSGTDIWRYGALGVTGGWSWWTSADGTISDFAFDPFTNSGPLVASSTALQQINTSAQGTTGNRFQDSNTRHLGLKALAAWKGRLFGAFDNGGGVGGVQAARSWSEGWQDVGSNWPQDAGGPRAAQGVGIYSNGSLSCIVTSTTGGTWIFKMP
jgi:hypothetical protein